ncbi:MAG: carboxypeptidase regulatory-like domain-containing protein, partial [Candidatus Magnetomorum sp.]|nr:carboxypeptidase regulatory-like domain-containing protein [Candidatus Magnetomorum sp.]
SLTVKGPGGQNTLIKTDLIIANLLQINFTAMPATGAFPLAVTFTAQMQSSVTGVVWNFGDGETSTHVQPTHTYNAPGCYTVQLTAYGAGTNATVIKKEYINVKGRNISGRVTASDTGTGLTGYQVEVIQRQSNLKVGETYTDADGYYSFICEPSAVTCLTTFHQIPAASDLILAVWPPLMKNDYYMQYYNGQSLEEKATLISTLDSDKTNINLTLEKVSGLGISGQVSDNGVPEAGIQVNAYSEKLTYGLSTLADANGNYTLSGLKPSNDYRVYVWGEEQTSDIYFALPENKIPGQDLSTFSAYKWDTATLVAPKDPYIKYIDIFIDHAINKRGSIQGHVYTSENKAAKGIWVYAFSDAIGTGNGAFTDQYGAYTITALPEVSETDPYTLGYVVAVHSVQNDSQDDSTPNLWYTYQAYPNVSDKALAERVKTNSSNIDFNLRTQCSLSGTVADIYGSFIPGAEINVRSDITGQVVSGITDQNGKYSIAGLSPVNDYVVTASAVYYPLMYYKGQSTQAKANRVDLSNGDVTEIDFALDTGLVIQGQIYLGSADTLAPSGLWVNIWSESTRTGGDVPTDSNGRYQMMGLNPTATDYIISIHKQDYMAAFYSDNQDSDLMNDTVYSSDDASGIAATTFQWAVDRNMLLRTGLSISGVVQYKGLPVSNIRVEAWAEATGGWGVSMSSGTITNGYNYIITGLPPGEYAVKIQPLYYQDDSYRIELTNTDIKNVYFPLQDLENMICGRVYGLDTGKKAQITAWSESTNFNKTLMLTGTGKELDYTIAQVKPSSDYRVKFTGYDYPIQVYNQHTSEDEADLITVLEGVVSGIDFHVSSGTQTLSGTITFPGSAVPGDIAWVDAFSPSTGSDGSVQVMLLEDRTANYKITGLKEAPDFTVVAWGKQYKEQYYANQTDADKATLVNTSDDIPDHHIDFDLTPGATIAGAVFEESLPVEGFQVIAISDKTSSFGGSTTAGDGTYLIEGLDLADDFVVKVQKSGMAPFYYHETSTTRDEKLATRVSTLTDNHVAGIDIYMAIQESISGTVRDEEGKALSGIWVNVWSDLQKTGEGMYTVEDGTYLINALPKSDDYKVSIGEHAALIYVPEEKTGVKSASSGVDFILRRAYQLKGTVGNASGELIVKAEVELYSENEDFYVWTKTDGSGTYNIQCVPSDNDYILSVMPPEGVSYVPFNESGLQMDSTTTINNSMQKNIVLKTASYINGYVYKSDTTTPVLNANVYVYSKDQNYGSVGKTDENGYYLINNIPIASDYEVSVKTAIFAKAIKTDQVTGSAVNFVLSPGGTLSGKVIEQDGAPLENVLVKVISLSAHISGIQRTNINGTFTISGMPRYLETGYEITDYVITIFPDDYAEQSQGQKRVGEYVTFVCKKAQITGTITDSLGKPKPEGVVVGIKLYKNITEGGFITKTDANSDGSFTLEGLALDTGYQLKIHIMKSKISTNVQWINQNETGVSGRNEAGVFMTGSHVDVRLSGTWDK